MEHLLLPPFIIDKPYSPTQVLSDPEFDLITKLNLETEYVQTIEDFVHQTDPTSRPQSALPIFFESLVNGIITSPHEPVSLKYFNTHYTKPHMLKVRCDVGLYIAFDRVTGERYKTHRKWPELPSLPDKLTMVQHYQTPDFPYLALVIPPNIEEMYKPLYKYLYAPTGYNVSKITLALTYATMQMPDYSDFMEALKNTDTYDAEQIKFNINHRYRDSEHILQRNNTDWKRY